MQKPIGTKEKSKMILNFKKVFKAKIKDKLNMTTEISSSRGRPSNLATDNVDLIVCDDFEEYFNGGSI